MQLRSGWRTAVVGFVAMFVTIGTGFSYGVLAVPAATGLGADVGLVSGGFAVTVMVFFLLGAPAGVLADRFGAKAVLGAGAACMGAGLLLTAAAQSVVMLYVGHGLLVGAAMASTFVPLTAAVSALFGQNRATAVGIAVSGIGVGTLVMAPVLASSIVRVGWRPTYAVLGIVSAVALTGCALLVERPPRHEPVAGDAARTMRSRDYRLLYASQVLLSVAIFTPFAHLPSYAEHLAIPAVAAAGLVAVIGAASVVGRLALGPVAGRFGLLRTYRACFVAIGASFVLWIWPLGYPGLVVQAVVFGVGYGGFVALLPGVAARRFGVHRLGGLLGVLYTSHVVGAGLGPLVTGLLVERWGYLPAGTAALVCGLAGFVVLGRLSERARDPASQSPSRR
ncbi:MFS transporter [Nocardioides mesophilus]|uniref:MFS transporter n=1 Tax=Nocardioides mesophilus TaxID=433659 RepID=A0A7G9RD72_9ACTN|nr:MFS transporter [Nocardioides mesophilus]QNN53547.1 MFS transporter [Nocardioides mesophilus]